MKLENVAIIRYTGPREDRRSKVLELTQEITRYLRSKGIAVETDLGCIQRGFRPDLICVLGGDGTFVGTVRKLLSLQAPFMGVNFGTKGFLLPFAPTGLINYLERLLDGYEPEYEDRTTIAAWVVKPGRTHGPFICVNEVTVKSDYAMVHLEVREGRRVRIQPRADGVIVATPTGSTAYGFNAGGIPLAWDSPNFAVTAIACANRVDSKCLVSNRQATRVEVLWGNPAFIPDGVTNNRIMLTTGDIVVIRNHKQSFCMLISDGFDSYTHMRSLLA